MSDQWKIEVDTSKLKSILDQHELPINKNYWLNSHNLKSSLDQKELQEYKKFLKELQDGKDVLQQDLENTIKYKKGLLTYKDETVLVYLKIHGHISIGEIRGKPEKGNKIHLVWCQTLKEKSALNIDNVNRFKTRYVATTRKDGLFKVETSDNKAYFAKLYPCKHCLDILTHEELKRWGVGEYPNDTCPDKRNKIIKNFNFSGFLDDTEGFSRYDSLPEHTDKTQPMDVYGPDFRPNAIFLKEKFGYKCQDCMVFLKNRKELLHAHHLTLKSKSSFDDLRVLCVDCHITLRHASEPVAAKNKAAILECREIKKQQGIPPLEFSFYCPHI